MAGSWKDQVAEGLERAGARAKPATAPAGKQHWLTAATGAAAPVVRLRVSHIAALAVHQESRQVYALTVVGEYPLTAPADTVEAALLDMERIEKEIGK
jgi:hypothetical protein